VENCKLRDYEGDYDLFLEKNEGEADAMADKEAKKKEVEKSQIKAKSKARHTGLCMVVVRSPAASVLADWVHCRRSSRL
jgi:ATPase subunit of ABC transporter with duplicated ATPase domains